MMRLGMPCERIDALETLVAGIRGVVCEHQIDIGLRGGAGRCSGCPDCQ